MKILRSSWAKGLAFLFVFLFAFLACFSAVTAYESGMIYDVFTSPEFLQSRGYKLRLVSIVRALEDVANQYLRYGKVPGLGRMAEFQDQFLFFASAGNTVYTNMEQNQVSYEELYEQYSIVYGLVSGAEGGQSVPYYYLYEYYDFRQSFSDPVYDSVEIYIVPRSDFLTEYDTAWIASKSAALRGLVFFSLAIVCSVFLMIVSGTVRSSGNPVTLCALDRVYSEFTLLVCGGGGAGAVLLLRQENYDRLQQAVNLFSPSFSVFRWLYAGAFLGCFGLCLLALLSIVRKGKQLAFFRTTLTWALCRLLWKCLKWTGRGLKHVWEAFLSITPYGKSGPGRRLFLRQLLFSVLEGVLLFVFLFCFVSFRPLVGLIPLLLLCICVMVQVWLNNRDYRELGKLLDHIQRLQAGELDYAAYVHPKSQVYPYELQLRTIGQGMDSSMRSQLRSERMKVDLVTNVSHDLRTPLTSLIGYLDLLAKLELSPVARDYVNVLTDKANHLKNLVSDVFVLAKATGGDEDVALERIDLFVLCEQTLADLEDAVLRSGREIRVSREEVSAPILSNGTKVYRIFQNLIDNALKYSMPGTRIWVNMHIDGEFARVQVKNTAGYEMHFSKEEILERFFRGDSSRTGDGSGLGLAIAKSFADQLGGLLDITIDGDQFSAEISFRLTEENGLS